MTLKSVYLCDHCSKELDPMGELVSVSVLHVHPAVGQPGRVELHYHEKCFDRARWPDVELPAPVPLPQPEPPADVSKPKKPRKPPKAGEQPKALQAK